MELCAWGENQQEIQMKIHNEFIFTETFNSFDETFVAGLYLWFYLLPSFCNQLSADLFGGGHERVDTNISRSWKINKIKVWFSFQNIVLVSMDMASNLILFRRFIFLECFVYVSGYDQLNHYDCCNDSIYIALWRWNPIIFIEKINCGKIRSNGKGEHCSTK